MPLSQELRDLITKRAAGVNAGGCAFDPARLLIAIAMVETSGGTNNVPRHEPGWCPNMRGLDIVRRSDGLRVTRGGANVNAISMQRFRIWGCSSCSSWGPWQILYHTAADRGYIGDPHDLAAPGVSILYVVLQLNRILSGPDPRETVEQIADAWNSGSYLDGNVPKEYLARVRAAYESNGS